jgi:hypothetical protein
LTFDVSVKRQAQNILQRLSKPLWDWKFCCLTTQQCVVQSQSITRVKPILAHFESSLAMLPVDWPFDFDNAIPFGMTFAPVSKLLQEGVFTHVGN